MIIVDDASPDDLKAIVDQFHDPRIRYYRNKTGFGGLNVVGNWNKCLEYCQGEYIVCMGDDDKLLPDCLTNYISLIERHPNLDVFHIRTQIINELDKVIDLQGPRPEWESIHSMIWNLWKGRDQFIGDFLFRTTALRQLGGFYFLPFAWSSDKITTFLLAATKGIANSNAFGFQYRRHSQTITKNNDNLRERYKALLQEQAWYHEFYNNLKEPTSDPDRTYYNLIVANIDSYMGRRMNDVISWDVTEHPTHLHHWMKQDALRNLSPRIRWHLRFVAWKSGLTKMLKLR